MRIPLIAVMVLSTALAGACSKDETASYEPAAPKETTSARAEAGHQLSPEQLGELGAKIEKAPEQAKELLAEHGLTEKTFEEQIRKVTEDLEASKRYAEAYKKAKA